jgi:ABC-2 type transport system permease protein
MPIIDQGYQHWSGEVAGHAWRWLAITRRGVKSALKLRTVRVTLLAAWVPALALAFVLCMWGLLERQSATIEALMPLIKSFVYDSILAGPREFRIQIWTICFHIFLYVELWFAMVLVLLVGPNLISQDLRYNALPLYLSRPLRRIDYFAGKLGIIVAITGLAMIVPSIVAWVLGVLFSLDFSIIRDTYRILLASIAYGLVVSVSAGLLMLAMSSLSRNSRYVALFWIGMWIISSTVASTLMLIDRENRVQERGWQPGKWSNPSFLNDEIAAAKTDWRPLISYTDNLQRIEERLLRTNAAWERLSELAPSNRRPAILRRLRGSQFPWYWSAAVLAMLAGASALVLKFSVKSLDKLK